MIIIKKENLLWRPALQKKDYVVPEVNHILYEVGEEPKEKWNQKVNEKLRLIEAAAQDETEEEWRLVKSALVESATDCV